MKNVLMALALVVLGAGCAKTNNDRQTTTTANVGTYQLVNGLCYSNNGQQVPANYCSQTSNTGYQLYNGQCIQTTNGQPVQANYCTQTGVGVTSQACYGSYYYNGQLGTCNGSNCSGYTLISASNGQQVYCQ